METKVEIETINLPRKAVSKKIFWEKEILNRNSRRGTKWILNSFSSGNN